MSRTKRFLRTFVVIIPMLLLCSISPAIMAWKGDTLSPFVGTNLHGKKCTAQGVPFGPFDYLQREKLAAELEVVEETHFSESVERLDAGQTSSAINDIHYTLMSWPNHHRALHSALRYRLQNLGDWPIENSATPAECYLQRAIKFSPKDPIPYMLYGIFLHQVKQYDEALKAYRNANRLLPNDILTQYNIGLVLVELKKYKEAEQVAKKVYGAGFPLPGLKNKLVAAGHWKTRSEVAGSKVVPSKEAVKTETKTEPEPETEPVLDKTVELDTAAPKKATTKKPAP
jgi:hypothetical protein